MHFTWVVVATVEKAITTLDVTVGAPVRSDTAELAMQQHRVVVE
jgi:hypothetical protein